jgi:hypothetical protein
MGGGNISIEGVDAYIGGVNAPIGAPIERENAPIGPPRPRGANYNNLDTIEEESILPYNATKSYENIRSINYLAFRQIIPKPDNKLIRPRVIS